MKHPLTAHPPYDAVLFDLLTALLDSWSLWNTVAGDAETGRRWRAEYLRITYQTGAYRPYEDLCAESARAVGLPERAARELDARFAELRPWPDVKDTLRELKAAGIPLGIVTNCSERLGRVAVEQVGVEFAVVVTAERAGYYKPDPRPYRLALEELGVEPGRCVFVAGSAYDLTGTAKFSMPTYWHDRVGMTPPPGAPEARLRERTLGKLVAMVLNR